jgi:hypothetical protein
VITVAGVPLALALSTAAGVAVVAAALGRATSAHEWLGRLVLGACVGLGGTSLLAFAWLFAVGGTRTGYAITDGLLCCVVVAACLGFERTRAALIPPRWNRAELVPLAALLVAAGFAAWQFVAANRLLPHGEWDAWAIWNFRARGIYRAGPDWRSAFDEKLVATSHPLLLSLSIVRLWAYGGESTLAPSVVAGLFTIGGPFVLAGLVTRVATVVAGTTAGLLLLGAANYQLQGPHQFADIPLAMFLAAGLGVLTVVDREPSARSATTAAILGGGLLGFAGWTKTDAIPGAVVAALVFAAVAARKGRGATMGRGIAIGAAAPALAWAIQHVVLSRELHAVLLPGQKHVAAKLIDPDRWLGTLAWFFEHAPGRDVWLPLVALGLAVLLGVRFRALLQSQALWCVAAMCLVAVLVFVLTPWDLSFHLLTAGDRVLFQPWPALLFALFASARPGPEGAPVPAVDPAA